MLREYWNTPRRTRLRAWIFRVHLWLGLVLGGLIAIIGLTGAIVVFRYEINRMTTPGTAYVSPLERRLSLDRMIDAVRAARPGEAIRNVSFEAGRDVAWNIRTESRDGRRVHNYVDQYRAVVTSQDDYSVRWTQWIFDLHAYLLAGKTGEFLNGFIALATMIMASTGLIVWWPGRLNWRFGLTYLASANWRRQNYDLHKLVGFCGSMLLVVVSFTGAYFAFPDLYKRAAGRLLSPTVTDPDKCADQGPRATTTMASRTVPYEQYIVNAERAAPGMRAVFIGFPEQRGAAVGVKMKGAKDWHRVGLSDVYLEPATADVIRVDRFDVLPAGSKFVRLMLPLHFGRFGGRLGLGGIGYYTVMVLYVVVGVAVPILMCTGYVMYWNRSLVKKLRRHRLVLRTAG